MATENFSLKPWDWMKKINEKLTFIILKAQDGKDISDDDYALLYMLFRDHWWGWYPLYGKKLAGKDELAVQQGLFTDNNETDKS